MGSFPQHDKALEVLTFRKIDRHWMVGRAAHALADIAVHPGVDAGRGHNLVKQVGADAPRAGIGEQDTPGLKQFKGQAVDVFVGARRPLGMGDKDALTSASIKLARSGAKPFSATLAAANSSAAPEESIDVTCCAPPDKAATVNPPVYEKQLSTLWNLRRRA